MKVELKNKIVLGLWLLGALSVLVLFVAASQKRKNSFCKGIKVDILSKDQNYFITQVDIENIVNAFGNITEKQVGSINIVQLEKQLKQNPWVKNAAIFFNNDNELVVNVEQRLPIARLFSTYGLSSYIDNNGLRLPIKTTANARVLVVTNFPSSNASLSKPDSNLLASVTYLANKIYVDTFWNAQIAQVNINDKGQFELVPTIGNHIIDFGDTTDTQMKLNKLYTFYTKAWLKSGIGVYEKLDLRFNNQVVATRKGTYELIRNDSTKTIADSLNNILGDSSKLVR